MSMQDRVDAVLGGAVSAGDVPGVVAGVTSASDTIYEAGFGSYGDSPLICSSSDPI